MDLSFDKLLEQFDLKRNEHQKNMSKINKRIDEIESHMDSIKKQIHQFDHQILKLEKDLNSTLIMINQENTTQSHQFSEEHKKHHNHHQEQHTWADNVLNKVEEFSANIFSDANPKNINKNDENQLNKRMSYNTLNKNKVKRANQYSANVVDENYVTTQDVDTGLSGVHHGNQIDQSNLHYSNDIPSHPESYIEQTNQQFKNEFSQESYVDQASLNSNNNLGNQAEQNLINNDDQDKTNTLEINYADLSIAEWEDKTTNLSMSEWFEVDPRTDQ